MQMPKTKQNYKKKYDEKYYKELDNLRKKYKVSSYKYE